MTTKITAVDLSRHAELSAQIADFNAKCKPLQDELKQIEKRAFNFLQESEKDTAKRGDYRISLIEKPGYQAWKTLALQWKPASAELPTPAPSKKLVITKA